MKASKTRLGLACGDDRGLAPLPAARRRPNTVVPPGNSAATQYTEAVPTAGGRKRPAGWKHGKSQSPAQGARQRATPRSSRRRGRKGAAAAEVAAATAPATVRRLATSHRRRRRQPRPKAATGHGTATAADGGNGTPGDRRPATRQRAPPADDSDLGLERAPERLLRARRGARPGDRLSSSGQLGPAAAAGRSLAAIAWSVAYLLATAAAGRLASLHAVSHPQRQTRAALQPACVAVLVVARLRRLRWPSPLAPRAPGPRAPLHTGVSNIGDNDPVAFERTPSAAGADDRPDRRCAGPHVAPARPAGQLEPGRPGRPQLRLGVHRLSGSAARSPPA